MTSEINTTRRGFLQSTGYLTLAFAIPLEDALSQGTPASAKPRLAGDLNIHRNLSAWLRVNANQTVTLMVGKVELGQGILTAVTQICADELDIDLQRVQVISGDTALVPNEGVTAGSFSMPYCATAVQQASAEVRAILVQLAADKFQQPVMSLSVKDGLIQSTSGAQVAYWDLVVGEALNREATGLVKFKPASEYRYIGRPVQRVDLTPKMLGQEMFIQEHHPEGMLYGHLVRPPTYQATLLSVNLALAQRMPGVVKVVRNGSFLGVIAKREGQALAAAKALTATAKWKVEKVLPGDDGILTGCERRRPTKLFKPKCSRVWVALCPLKPCKPRTTGRTTCTPQSVPRRRLRLWVQTA
jgi:CO/xanthine dehydrogenase Mo-binding subunit